jgi:transcriptional regulator with PAS, ATPase and Fis domain
LWQLLWEYNPNGLIVVGADLYIKIVNPAFCAMFQINAENLVDQPVSVIFDDVSDLQWVWNTGKIIKGKKQMYPLFNLYVNQVIFSIESEGVIVCIMIDISDELGQEKELRQIKMETIKKVNEVVDKQMKVVQEIAGLLGETTAETKVSLLKIIEMFEQENI